MARGAVECRSLYASLTLKGSSTTTSLGLRYASCLQQQTELLSGHSVFGTVPWTNSASEAAATYGQMAFMQWALDSRRFLQVKPTGGWLGGVEARLHLVLLRCAVVQRSRRVAIARAAARGALTEENASMGAAMAQAAARPLCAGTDLLLLLRLARRWRQLLLPRLAHRRRASPAAAASAAAPCAWLAHVAGRDTGAGAATERSALSSDKMSLSASPTPSPPPDEAPCDAGVASATAAAEAAARAPCVEADVSVARAITGAAVNIEVAAHAVIGAADADVAQLSRAPLVEVSEDTAGAAAVAVLRGVGAAACAALDGAAAAALRVQQRAPQRARCLRAPLPLQRSVAQPI
ncbi:hypothetical protein JKP88DRAFT_290199 [Tribonema minus]|uniref:Uncharacterized protein n=1 Tax=Tribonema minus TaxID=303371 RepID=A0A835YYN3_9STRA|nr:hypothetical protein JKP88DRAFT_290199 [Tribonema minus]